MGFKALIFTIDVIVTLVTIVNGVTFYMRLYPINNTTDSISFKFSEPNLESLEVVFEYDGKVIAKEVLFENSSFSRIPKKTFEILSEVTIIKMVSCGLKEIQKNDFYTGNTNDKIRSLYINNNQLEVLPERVFEHLPNLKSLALGNNQLKGLDPGCFVGLNALESLSMDANKLEELPMDIFAPLKKLFWIDLDHNNIKVLEDHVFRNNPSLRVVYLERNNLRIIDDTIVQRHQLKTNASQATNLVRLNLSSVYHLDVSDNYLPYLTSDMLASMKELRTFRATNVKLKAISEGAFSNKSDLEHLFLSYNDLQKFDVSLLRSCSNLKKLYIDGNKLEELDFVGLLKNKSMKIVYLAENLWSCDHSIQMKKFFRSMSIETDLVDCLLTSTTAESSKNSTQEELSNTTPEELAATASTPGIPPDSSHCDRYILMGVASAAILYGIIMTICYFWRRRYSPVQEYRLPLDNLQTQVAQKK